MPSEDRDSCFPLVTVVAAESMRSYELPVPPASWDDLLSALLLLGSTSGSEKRANLIQDGTKMEPDCEFMPN